MTVYLLTHFNYQEDEKEVLDSETFTNKESAMFHFNELIEGYIAEVKENDDYQIDLFDIGQVKHFNLYRKGDYNIDRVKIILKTQYMDAVQGGI